MELIQNHISTELKSRVTATDGDVHITGLSVITWVEISPPSMPLSAKKWHGYHQHAYLYH